MTALAPLWQIDEELRALLDCLETCPDELQPELQAKIAAYMGQSAAKIDQTAHVLAALDYEQKAAADEIARLQERKKAAKASQDRLEAYVCRVIAARGGTALNGNTNTLSVRPSEAVVITDEIEVPDDFKMASVKLPLRLWNTVCGSAIAFAHHDTVAELDGVKVEESVSAAAIKKALKAGEVVPGADLEFRSNLQRK